MDAKKRKHSLESSPSSPLDALWKRQRRLSSSHSPYPSSSSTSSLVAPSSYLTRASLSDSDPDEDDAGPSTPAFFDDNMDWTPDMTTSSTPDLVVPNPNQLSTRIPQGRDSSPSSDGGIHHLQLLREAKPPVIVPYAAPSLPSFHHRSPPRAVMRLEVRPDAYAFNVELPGYAPEAITVSCKKGNVVTVVADIWHLPRECRQQWDITFDSDVHTADIRASMDQATHILTLTARRFRQYIPIEYQVRYNKPSPQSYLPRHPPPTTSPMSTQPTTTSTTRSILSSTVSARPP